MPPRAETSPRFCLACHGNRLASLLETASLFRLYRLAPRSVVSEGVCLMPDEGLPALAAMLARAGVVLLVCGGATCCCLAHFQRAGVQVAPWIAGDVETVLGAIAHNQLDTLLVPGARPGPGRSLCRKILPTRLEKTP